MSAFRSRALAEELRSRLAARGFDAHVFPSITEDGRPRYRVRVGAYASRDDAERVAAELRSERGLNPLVTPRAPGRAACRRGSSASSFPPRTSRRASRELGRQIRADYAGRTPVLVGVLKGAVVFLADLMRAIEAPLRVRLHRRLVVRGVDALLRGRGADQGPLGRRSRAGTS